MTQFKKGQKIDNYEILEPNFGVGASGPVCLASDSNGRRCVIKFLARSEEDAQSGLLKEEYRYLTELRHSNIASVLGFGFYSGLFYLVTEFVGGQSLFEYCYNKSPSEAIPIFLDALEAMDFIHKSGFLHLDIKPENIIVDEKTSRAKIIDLGTAARMGSFRNLGQGTVPYIAPEIVLGLDNLVDGRADLFSFGVTMYYCLTRGELPFLQRNAAIEKNSVNYERLKSIIVSEQSPKPPSSLRRGITELADKVILHLLARDPADRFYPNARAIINAVRSTKEENFGVIKGVSSYLRPTGDEHIGRDDLKKHLHILLHDLYSGNQPDAALFYVNGEYGMGKSHLLSKIKQETLIHSRDVYLAEICFPAEIAEFENWQTTLYKEIAENRRSILVLIDDIHEAGELKDDLQSIIKSVTERALNQKLSENLKRIMIIAAGEGLNVCEHPAYELKPFTKGELEKYLELTPAFHGQKISQKWLNNLYWSSSGIPLEVINKLEEKDLRGVLITSLEGDIIAHPIDESSIHMTSWHGVPQTTKERLLRQYNKLSAREKEFLNFIAAWNYKGVSAPLKENEAHTFFGSSSTGQLITNMIEKGLIVKRADTLEFANPFMTAVFYEQMPQADREYIHDFVADRLKNDLEGVLLHKGFGSNKLLGARCLVKLAMKLANERGRLRLAVELLNSAAERIGGGPLLSYIQCLLVEYYSNRGEYKKARDAFEHARQGAGHIWLGQLSRRIIPTLLAQREFETADKITLEFKNLAAQPATPTSLIIKNWEGRKFYYEYFRGTGGSNNLKRAEDIFKETEVEEKSIPEFNRTRIYNNELGNVLLAMGDCAGAVAKLKEKFTRHEKEKNYVAAISVLCAIASAYKMLKKYDEASIVVNRALDLSKKVGGGKWLLTGHFILSNIYHDAQKFKESIEEGHRCFAVGPMLEEAEEWRNVQRQLMVYMGDSYLEMKEYNKSVLYFEESLKQDMNDELRAMAHAGLAEAYNKLDK